MKILPSNRSSRLVTLIAMVIVMWLLNSGERCVDYDCSPRTDDPVFAWLDVNITGQPQSGHNLDSIAFSFHAISDDHNEKLNGFTTDQILNVWWQRVGGAELKQYSWAITKIGSTITATRTLQAPAGQHLNGDYLVVFSWSDLAGMHLLYSDTAHCTVDFAGSTSR